MLSNNCNWRKTHLEKKYLNYNILIISKDRSTNEILRSFFNLKLN